MQATNSLLYIFIYVLFFGFSWFSIIKGTHRLINDDGVFTQKPLGLIIAHGIGILWLGIIPLFLLNQYDIQDLKGPKSLNLFSLSLVFMLLVLIIVIALYQSKNAFENKQNSSGKVIHLSSQFFISYFIVRALFLFSYELWFRGILLFGCIHWFGIPLAVFINVLFYVLLHIFNSKKEMLACIPFGLFVCVLNIIFNSIFPAIILHIGFSLAYEINIYRFNLVNIKTVKS